MSNDRFNGEGVDDVFGSIASGDGVGELVKLPDANTSERKVDKPVDKPDEPVQQRNVKTRPKARIGRFPGRKVSANTIPMERISARISADLKDQYVEWALDERVPVNDLMERALTESYKRHRVNQLDPSSD